MFVFQKRAFDFTVANKSRVPMTISWLFEIDEDFPTRTDETGKARLQMFHYRFLSSSISICVHITRMFVLSLHCYVGTVLLSHDGSDH